MANIILVVEEYGTSFIHAPTPYVAHYSTHTTVHYSTHTTVHYSTHTTVHYSTHTTVHYSTHTTSPEMFSYENSPETSERWCPGFAVKKKQSFVVATTSQHLPRRRSKISAHHILTWRLTATNRDGTIFLWRTAEPGVQVLAPRRTRTPLFA